MFCQPEISDYKREKLMAYAMKALESQAHLQTMGGIHALMLKQAQSHGFTAWQHYPNGDRIDYQSGGQYYYHCHRENMDTQEHGHFHLFIRQKGEAKLGGWPASYSLANIPEKKKYINSPMTHVITIGVNRYGVPIRLFTVNRWVTKESWFEADKMQKLIKRFSLAHVKTRKEQRDEWRVVDMWLENLVHLFASQIHWLLAQRDIAMARYIAANPEIENPYEHKALEELSSLDIDLQAQVGWLTQGLANVA